MKRLFTILIFCLLPLSAYAWGVVGMSGGVVGGGGGGGPDTWYYAGGSDSYTETGFFNITDQGFFAAFSVSSGSLTKVGVKICATLTEDADIKIGIYTGTPTSLTLQQCVSFTIPEGTVAGWYDYTLPTSVNESTGTIYLSLFGYGGTNISYNTSGGYWIYDTYANACQSTESSDADDDWLPAVRCYVD